MDGVSNSCSIIDKFERAPIIDWLDEFSGESIVGGNSLTHGVELTYFIIYYSRIVFTKSSWTPVKAKVRIIKLVHGWGCNVHTSYPI